MAITVQSEIDLEAHRVAAVADLVRKLTAPPGELVSPDLLEASAECAHDALADMRERRQWLAEGKR